jgi:hypothetical protein
VAAERAKEADLLRPRGIRRVRRLNGIGRGRVAGGRGLVSGILAMLHHGIVAFASLRLPQSGQERQNETGHERLTLVAH